MKIDIAYMTYSKVTEIKVLVRRNGAIMLFICFL